MLGPNTEGDGCRRDRASDREPLDVASDSLLCRAALLAKRIGSRSPRQREARPACDRDSDRLWVVSAPIVSW